MAVAVAVAVAGGGAMMMECVSNGKKMGTSTETKDHRD